MMKTKFISSSRRIFQIKFTTSTEWFLVQDRQLFDLIKENNGEIDFVKCSEDYTLKFKRCSKALILRQFSFDTEVMEYFKTLPFFKGVKYL